jgi:hypothetical protein
MEPITCLLGIFDLILAYSYWLSKNKKYEWSALYENGVEKRKNKFLLKEDQLFAEF